ncbi:hypothetical protein CXG81DRAFT_4432, partial [Caulochytrium protostelioides]
MKYLAVESFEDLNNVLSVIDTADARIFGRLEAYTFKSTGEDKKLRNHIENKYDQAKQPPPAPPPAFRNLESPHTRKTFFYLLATLNAAYPDYDFSDIQPDYFDRVPSLSVAVNTVGATLLNLLGDSKGTQELGERIWDAIDEVTDLANCQIYSFHPDPEIEPDAGFDEEGNVSRNLAAPFYFFFVNTKMKRLSFFTARAVNNIVSRWNLDQDGRVIDDESEDAV